nr:hypothetical protein CFP56_33604 [Quercus suber]
MQGSGVRSAENGAVVPLRDAFQSLNGGMPVDCVSAKNWRSVIDTTQQNGRHFEPFCHNAALGDPKKAIWNTNAAQLKAFFQWIVENAERTAPQDGTLRQYVSVFEMIYVRDTGTILGEDVISAVKLSRGVAKYGLQNVVAANVGGGVNAQSPYDTSLRQYVTNRMKQSLSLLLTDERRNKS